MRIRSIKPEFYRSEDIDCLRRDERLLFIALWSYVDDNGVGRNKLSEIAADLFAGDLEKDPRETFAWVSRGLQNLSEAGRITRYTVSGRGYLHITNWDKHQRIDKPNKERYPLPTCDDAEICDTLATPSRDSSETPAPGTGEQGNRGTGEQGITTTDLASSVGAPAGDVAIVNNAPTTATLLAEWIDHCGEPPPSRVKGHVAKEVKLLLDEGIDYQRVRTGLAQWNGKGLHPSTLPSIVHGVGNTRTISRRQQETDDWFETAMREAIDEERSA